MYTKKLFYYFQHPVNMGTITNPTVVAQVGNPVCGDVMKLYLKIDLKVQRFKGLKKTV
jgi:nitrogen fixation NifU-like protein